MYHLLVGHAFFCVDRSYRCDLTVPWRNHHHHHHHHHQLLLLLLLLLLVVVVVVLVRTRSRVACQLVVAWGSMMDSWQQPCPVRRVTPTPAVAVVQMSLRHTYVSQLSIIHCCTVDARQLQPITFNAATIGCVSEHWHCGQVSRVSRRRQREIFYVQPTNHGGRE